MSDFEWIAFDKELPAFGKLILYGNHRWVKTCLYTTKNDVREKLHFKTVTHWCYVKELPPVMKDSGEDSQGLEI